jgi:triphosphoribosyl-dephospho-CoA synthetase
MKKNDLTNKIVGSAILALLYEVSVHPKPLNVTKIKSIGNLKFENFLATTAYNALTFYSAFRDGYVKRFRIGKRIYEATELMLKYQSQGNTSLGSLMLLIPLITSSALCFKESKEISIEKLRDCLKIVLDSSEPEDSIMICKAILLTKPKWLLKQEEFDITKKDWEREILEKKAKPREIMRSATQYDWIAHEYYTYYKITFEESLPLLLKYSNEESLNRACLRTFLTLLSKRIDSHVYRKFGYEIAERIRKFVDEKMKTKKDIEIIANEIDEEFSSLKINAGTTADLIVASLFLLFLTEDSRRYI